MISGRGSNLRSLIAACTAEGFPAHIALVISNRPEAPGLLPASEAGISIQVIDHRGFPTKAAFESRLDTTLREARVELVCLAGFMRLLSPSFVKAWRNRLLNIHPSLLPAFPGLHTHERALAAGVAVHGATVHLVRAETDSGPVVVQGAVPVLPGDTPDRLAARVLDIEHRLYPLALELIASGAAVVDGGSVSIPDATKAAHPGLIWPD